MRLSKTARLGPRLCATRSRKSSILACEAQLLVLFIRPACAGRVPQGEARPPLFHLFLNKLVLIGLYKNPASTEFLAYTKLLPVNTYQVSNRLLQKWSTIVIPSLEAFN